MIRLKPYKDDSLISTYVEDKLKKIRKKYLDLPIEYKEYLVRQFPNAFDEATIKERFFESLLSDNITSVIDTYGFIELYYQIAFFASLDIEDIVSDISAQEAKLLRSAYLDNYIEVCVKFKQKPLLEEYQKAQGIRSNIKNLIRERNVVFQNFQEFIKKEVLQSTKVDDELVRFGLWEQMLDYKAMVSSREKMEIVKDLGIIVCPYCNRSYISNFEDNWKHEERTSADLDHFYPKGDFKIFQLSLYNFIPSCKMCNSLFKWGKNMDILNPYEDAYEEKAFFKLVNKNVENEAADIYGWSCGKKLDIECLANIDKEKKMAIEREIKLFRIKEIYQVHNEYAERLRYKRNVLGGKIRSEVLELVNRDMDVKMSESELDEVFYGIDLSKIRKEYLKVPLSKMIHDILLE